MEKGRLELLVRTHRPPLSLVRQHQVMSLTTRRPTSHPLLYYPQPTVCLHSSNYIMITTSTLNLYHIFESQLLHTHNTSFKIIMGSSLIEVNWSFYCNDVQVFVVELDSYPEQVSFPVSDT